MNVLNAMHVSPMIPTSYQNNTLVEDAYKVLMAHQEARQVQQLVEVTNRINADAKINIPYFINNCNYVASLSRHNYSYELGRQK